MKRFFALTALVILVGSAGTAMAGDHNVAVSIGIPGQVYVDAQSDHHPQPVRVHERSDYDHGRHSQPARYESRPGHAQPPHHAAAHREERHSRHGHQENRHEYRGHDSHGQGSRGHH